VELAGPEAIVVVVVVVVVRILYGPRHSIIICRLQLGKATGQLYQWTGINAVRHRLWLSTGTQVRVDLSPSLPTGTTMTARSAEAIQERPLSSREVKTWLLDRGDSHYVGVDHRGRIPIQQFRSDQ